MNRTRSLLVSGALACLTGSLATAATGCVGHFSAEGPSFFEIEVKAPEERPVTLYRTEVASVEWTIWRTVTTYKIYNLCTSPCFATLNPGDEVFFGREDAPESSHFYPSAAGTAVVSPGHKTAYTLSFVGIVLGGIGTMAGGIVTGLVASQNRNRDEALARSGAVLGVSLGLLAGSIVGWAFSRTSFEMIPKPTEQAGD